MTLFQYPIIISRGGIEVARAHSVEGSAAVANIFTKCKLGHSFGGNHSDATIITAMAYDRKTPHNV